VHAGETRQRTPLENLVDRLKRALPRRSIPLWRVGSVGCYRAIDRQHRPPEFHECLQFIAHLSLLRDISVRSPSPKGRHFPFAAGGSGSRGFFGAGLRRRRSAARRIPLATSLSIRCRFCRSRSSAAAHRRSSRRDIAASPHVLGVVSGTDSLFNTWKEELAALSVRHGVPTMHQYREFVAAGGLIGYDATQTAELSRQVGVYTGRILKGEKPADMPISQPTKVELFINLKTAKALGLTVPLSLLTRADELIE
jgi:hypothetical protein